MTQVSESPANSQHEHIFISADICSWRITVARRNLDYEDAQDQYLFEPDYTIAGSTGFLLWPGSYVLLELLKGRLGERLHGKRLVELGSGIGLAGLCAAAAGAHVLMTDLPSVVHGILERNVAKNARTMGDDDCPVQNGAGPQHPAPCNRSPGWAGAVPVGLQRGSAACAPLDWSVPLAPQVTSAAAKGLDMASADVLLACDVVWLKELLLPFRNTVVGLLQLCQPGTPCLLTFLDRAKSTSGNFSSRADVGLVFQQQGCQLEVYHSQVVMVDGEALTAEVLEITLGQQHEAVEGRSNV